MFLFYLMMLAGFFFSTEMAQDVTNALIPIEVERQFNNLVDLKNSNLTLILTKKTTGKESRRVRSWQMQECDSVVKHQLHGEKSQFQQREQQGNEIDQQDDDFQEHLSFRCF